MSELGQDSRRLARNVLDGITQSKIAEETGYGLDYSNGKFPQKSALTLLTSLPDMALGSKATKQ